MKVIISGAGIAGLAAAVEFGRRGWEVLVVEHAPALRSGGYMIDFFGPGYDAAEEMGLLDALQARAYDIKSVELVNVDGSRQAGTDYELFRKSVGGRLFSLLRGDIEAVLHEALPAGVTLRFATSIAQIHSVEGGVDVTLSDGERVSADLLIGADGIHSTVRSQLFGPEAQFVGDLGYRTVAYVFESEAVRQQIGDKFVMISAPGRQVGIYRLRDGTVTAFFVWRGAERLESLAKVLPEIFGDMEWLVPDVLKAMPDNGEVYADLTGQVHMPSWRKGRAILLGDAAYAVSLLAGQGASLAIGGAHALGRAIASHENLATGLDAYEALIGPEAVRKQAAGRRAAKWIVPPTRFHVWMRAVVFGLTSVPVLSRIFNRIIAPSAKGVFSARNE